MILNETKPVFILALITSFSCQGFRQNYFWCETECVALIETASSRTPPALALPSFPFLLGAQPKQQRTFQVILWATLKRGVCVAFLLEKFW